MAQQEVISNLREFTKKFSTLTFRYWIDTVDGDHIIEVDPPSFEDSDLFLDAEIDFLKNFYEKFPSHSISFLKSSEIMFREDLKLIITFNLLTWFDVIGNKSENKGFAIAYEPSCDQLNYAA